MNVRLISLVLFGITLSAPSAMAGNIVVNPGFESGFLPGWSVNMASTSPWMIDFLPNGGIRNIDTSCGGAICLDPVSGSFFYQDLPTSIGLTYTLSFWAFFEGFAVGKPEELKVTWGGTTALDIVNPPVDPDVYNQYSAFDLVATSSTTRLQFFGRDDINQIGVDDISVTANPEPSTFLLISVALLIAAGYRSRSSGTPVVAPANSSK